MEPHLQHVEVEPVLGGDHDLTVEQVVVDPNRLAGMDREIESKVVVARIEDA
jgi:hypothetical protein